MWLTLVLAGLLTAGGPIARNSEPDVEARGPLAVKMRFLAEVRACGVTPAFEPDLRMETTPVIITYRSAPRSVLVARWGELPESFHGMIAQWAASTAPEETPQTFFQNGFQDIGVAHELGHWLQHQSGRSHGLSEWDSEVEANRIGIAFARLRDGPEVTAHRMERFGWLLTLPYQPPQGRDLVDYFNTEYATLTRDPVAYGWFQGSIIKSALDLGREEGFCDLVRLNAPPASGASPG